MTLGMAAVFLLVIGGPLHAQEQFLPGDTVIVAASDRYGAGGLHRWFLGAGYRDLWALPIRVPVLDSRTFRGGLTPLGVEGPEEDPTLLLRGGDGVIYGFSAVDKDARRGLDPVLRESLAADLVQDQISSLMPLSRLVVAELLDAADLFHAHPLLFVMPDDPLLGDYREAFAGLLGWMEPRPWGAENGAPEPSRGPRLVDSEELHHLLDTGWDHQVDERAYLKARYIDFLVGDWDRHPDQWRWVGSRDRVGDREVTVFHPVPRERDWALARVDGLVQTLLSIPYPQYVGFSGEFPDPVAASWNGRGLDRRLLSELSASDFAEVAAEITAQITDEVIERAVRLLPDAYYELEGPALEANLKRRREDLADFGQRYHALLARWVDVEATDEDELIRVDRESDGSTTITIHDLRDGAPGVAPWYRRSFPPSRTEEIRIHARGGADRMEVRGRAVEGTMRIRLLGGGGDDTYDDSTSGANLAVHDHEGEDRFSLGPRASLDVSEWEPGDDPEADVHAARSRDWGTRWVPAPVVGVNPDDGLVLGGAISRFGYSFRRFPWADQLDLEVSIGTATWRPNASVAYHTRSRGRTFRGEYRASWQGARADRFYGFGNDVAAPGEVELYRARRSEFSASAGFFADVATGASLGLQAGYRRLDAQENPGTIIAALNPYGYGEFQQLEFTALASIDRRDERWEPRSGYRAGLAAGFSPAALDVAESYGFVDADISGYFGLGALPLEPTLAVRALGRHTFGNIPYFAGAALGGAHTLRGYRNQRFLGESSLALSSELRVSLGNPLVLFPGEIGVLGLVDAGRVWVDGASPGSWNATSGFGLWATLVDEYAASLTLTRGEIWAVYFALGMPF